MILTIQRRLAAQVMDIGLDRVWFDTERLEEVKESITRADIRRLISDGAIREKPKIGISKARTRKAKEQKRKGRQKGSGAKKGKKTARTGKKELWVIKIRLQRKFLKLLKEKEIIEQKIYSNLMRKAKGGFFRSKRHIKLYIEDQELVKK